MARSKLHIPATRHVFVTISIQFMEGGLEPSPHSIVWITGGLIESTEAAMAMAVDDDGER